jgi:hypothetical protein
MRKFILLNLAAAVVVSSLFYTSCKTPTHATQPSPVNNRLLSYTKFTTSIYGVPVNESYTFSYDSKKRLSQILYASNDSVAVVNNMESLRSVFTYSNDSIYKVTSSAKSGLVVELDTFITNSKGQLTEVYMPTYSAQFTYFGTLVASKTETEKSPAMTFTTSSTYTSDNGDLLSRSSLGITGFTLGTGAIDSTIFNTLSFIRDAYTVYPDLANRVGDYYQLQSFTAYGVTLYANAHLLKSVNGTGATINAGLLSITYDIDADSKVTQTYVSGYGYVTSPVTTYKLQYEQY